VTAFAILEASCFMLCNAAMALHLFCLGKPIPGQRNLETRLLKNQIDSPPIGEPLNCEGCPMFLQDGVEQLPTLGLERHGQLTENATSQGVQEIANA
jgi:hypothetical protein